MRPIRLTLILLSFLWMAGPMSAQTQRQHKVASGETFATIAQKYGISESQLKSANPKYSVCYAGLTLTIPPAPSAASSQPAASAPAPKPDEPKGYRMDLTPQAAATPAPRRERAAPAGPDKAERKARRKEFWAKVGAVASVTGDALVAVADGLTEIADQVQDLQASRSGSSAPARTAGTTSSRSRSADAPDAEEESSGEMIPIASLIRKYESEIASMQRELDENQRRLEAYMERNKTTQIDHGKVVKRISKSAPRFEGINTTAKKGVINEWQRRLQWLRQRQQKSAYISREEYDRFLGLRKAQEEADREARKKLQKARDDQRMGKVYRDYVGYLIKAYYDPLNNGYYLSHRVEYQKKMRELRIKHGLNKSEWEDWDGTFGSMR